MLLTIDNNTIWYCCIHMVDMYKHIFIGIWHYRSANGGKFQSRDTENFLLKSAAKKWVHNFVLFQVEIALFLVANVVITRLLTWVCSNVLVPPVSWSEVAVSRDDLLDRSEPLENHNTTDDHLTSVIALSFTRWQHQHTQYIPQVAAPLPNRPNHHNITKLNRNRNGFLKIKIIIK